MPDQQFLSKALVALLDLEHPPVAITFEQQVPVDRRFFDEPMTAPTADGRSGRVGASCVFWMHAVDRAFSTMPEDHGNCSVGRYTHGLAGAEETLAKSDVAALLEVGWVTMETFAGVAHLSRPPAAISYGPLSTATEPPDVVLLRVNPRQMMEIADAVPVEFSGKPQCQILPRAAAQGVIAASMGCALSRARTGMGDEELTCALPARRLGELVEALAGVRRADDAVTAFAADARRS